VYYQFNSCTGDTRTVAGTQSTGWVPDLDAQDVCAGESITQTKQCSPLADTPTQVVTGTSKASNCVSPVTEFIVSTDLTNWGSCADIEPIRLSQSDQVIYVQASGTEPADSWTISHTTTGSSTEPKETGLFGLSSDPLLGEDGNTGATPSETLVGEASVYEEKIWEISFDFPDEQNKYDDVSITMESPAGNTSTQLCDISALSIQFEEN
jgi:hypothetical protein